MTLFKHYAGATRSSIATRTIALLVLAVVGFALAFAGSARSATTINLGAAASFGALSFTAMTNADADGPTVVNGDVGSPTSVDVGVTNTGFARYNGPADAAGMAGAQAAVTAAYLAAEAQPSSDTITAGTLAGSYGPGVYDASSAILITGSVTLDGGGDPNAVFIFRAVSDLTVDPGASITLTGSANPCNVFWKVQSAFLKNTGSTFVGTILALTQITLTNNITVQGRVLARNADVTFIHDTINAPAGCATQSTTTETTTTTTPTTTAETTTEATTTAQTTTTSQATTTTPPATTTPVVTSTPATTTTPAAATTTTTPATTPTTTTTAPAKPGAVKGATKTIGHARPARRSFGFTG